MLQHALMKKQKTSPKPDDALFRLWSLIAERPYPALPWLVFFYAFVSCLVYTDNGPFTGHIVGFDDQVRMTQVMQWVNGGGWYDRLITRVNAPEGFQTIWARIVDIPIAAVIVLFQQFIDQRSAALVASVIIPMAELAILFWASRYFARPLAGKKEAWLVVLFVMFTTALDHKPFTLSGFHPGEASHHAWYGILNVLMFGAAARVVLGVTGWKPKGMLALAIALLLAVGIEGFPMIAGVVAILSILSWFFKNQHLAFRGAQALGCSAILSLALLPMHVPPSHFFEVSFSQPSILGPVILISVATYLFLQSVLLQKSNSRFVNALGLIVLAGNIALFLIQAFPGILGGSLAGLSPNEQILAKNEHPEVWSMYRVAGPTVDYVGLVMPSLLAVIAGIWAAVKAKSNRRRVMCLAYTGFAAVPSGLAQIYWRFIHHAQTAVCPLLLGLWQAIRNRLPKNTTYSLRSFLIFVTIGPLWMIIVPALHSNAPFLTQVAFFPAKIYTEPYSCDTLTMTDYLNKHYSKDTLINVPDWDTATFLYETNLKVDFLSNYPSHDHFLDNRLFFQTQDVESAKEVAAKHKFNLVAMCTIIPMPPEMAASRPNREPTMLERMKEGIQPSWLKPVFTGINTRYLLFEVDQAALAKSKDK